MDPEEMAKGSVLRRIWSILFLMPSWFAFHSTLRIFFHRLRGVKIGKNVEVGYFCIIGNVHPYMVTIEEGAVISARATLLEHDNSYYFTRGGKIKFGPVVIKKKAFIGLNSVIMPNVTVGERSIVGANSLVLKDVPPDTVVGGVPAKEIKKFH